MTFLSELEGLMAVVNDCANCGTLPADTSQWSSTQVAWATSWRAWFLDVIAGTAQLANRPPRKPPI